MTRPWTHGRAAPRRVIRSAGLALFAFAFACAAPYEPPSLEGIRYESGNDQTGIAGGPLPQQLVVKAFNQDDAPIAGARVQFSATSGGFDQAVKFSDAEGFAKVTYTLGGSAGPVEITASTLAGEVVVRFTATAELGPPDSLVLVSGNNQSGVAGSTLPTPLRVRVVNPYNVGLPGEVVTWSVLAGDGSLSEATSATDETGYAQVGFTLGFGVGVQSVSATSGSLTPVTFDATATEPPPPSEEPLE